MLKDDLKRELQYKMRSRIAEKQPEEKTFDGFLSNLTEDITTFGKGLLSVGKQVFTHPIKSAKTVGGIGKEIGPSLPSAAKEMVTEMGETFIHPIKRAKAIKTEWNKLRAISYDEQKQFIEESLSQAAGIQNKNKRLASQIGIGLIGDFMHEVSHPLEFLYEKPFTFGIDIMAAGGGKVVGKATRLTKPILKETKLAKSLEQIFIPSAKLKSAGYGKVADDIANTSEKIYNMQEGIIKSTAHKFEKVFGLSRKERLEFFDTIDTLRRKTTKAISKNPKIQKAIDWWLNIEVPKLSKVTGLPAEKQIRNYLHHFFPEKLSQAEKATKPFKVQKGYLKKSKDIAGFTKDPIVSISAIKIKVGMDAIKNAFLKRTSDKYSKSWDALREEFKGIVGKEKFASLEASKHLSETLQKRMGIDSFSPRTGITHWFPKEIASELNKLYGKNTVLDTIRVLLTPLDYFNRNWKPLATAVRPRYHTRNVIGNLYNAIVIGKMNPLRPFPAAVQQVAGYLNEVRKGTGLKAGMTRKLFPNKVSSKYIDLAMKNNIIGRGFFSIDLHDMAKVSQFTTDIIKIIKRVREPAEIYKIPALKQYLHVSRSIGTALEDNARLAMFIDFCKKAKSTSPKTIAAAKLHVNKHLFDYLAGLGEGDRFIKKFIPFWAWTRFNLPLQTEAIFTIPRRMQAIQKGTAPHVREEEKLDPNVKFFTEQEKRMGLFKTGEIEYNGKTLDKYMRTQSVLPQADLLKIVELFELDLNALGINPIFGVLTRLKTNLTYFGGQIERFTGERGKFLEVPMGKREMEIAKIIPFLNEINKWIGGSYVDEDKPPHAIRLEQVISPLGVTLKDPDQVKYFGILQAEAELKGSFEAGLESLYVRYLSESSQHPEELQFKQNIELLEKLLIQKGLTKLDLVPLKIKATKRALQNQLREKIKYGELDEKRDQSLRDKIKSYFGPIPNQVRVRDITRELYELIMPDIAQTPEEAKKMNYKPTSERYMTEENYGLYTSPDGFLVMIDEKGGQGVDMLAGVGSMKQIGKEAIKQIKPSVFSGFKDLTTNILNNLQGRYRVSKQFIIDLTKRSEVKKVEREIIEEVLIEMPKGRINVQDFADKVKSKLLPLRETFSVKKTPAAGSLEGTFYPNFYPNVILPSNIRGNVITYSEHIYESPIKTSAGEIHFSKDLFPNYFAHTRIEDIADSKTSRVIELQSDLFQKRGLKSEIPQPTELNQFWMTKIDGYSFKSFNNGRFEMTRPISTQDGVDLVSKSFTPDELKKMAPSLALKIETFVASAQTRVEKISTLQSYRNTWHERIIKEEIKRVAKDGKTKLQFPTGETAMKIEGLGETAQWYTGAIKDLSPADLKVGLEINTQRLAFRQPSEASDNWIIIEVLGDGKFKAVPKRIIDVYKSDKFKEIPFNEFHKSILAENGKYLDEIDPAIWKKDYLSDLKLKSEQFDISSKIDTSNPIYKFYENDIQKFLKRIRPETKRIKDPQGVEWFEIPITKTDATSPVDAFSQSAIPAGILGAEIATDKKEKEEAKERDTEKKKERRELKPGETMFDMKTGIEFYRPEEKEVEIIEANDKREIKIGTEEEFKTKQEFEESETSYKIDSTDPTVKRLAKWTKGEATFYDPLDSKQTRPNTTGVGAYGRKIERGSIAFGNRYFQQQLKAGTMIYIQIEEFKDINTPYGKGIFRVDDTMKRRYSKRGQFNIDFNAADFDEVKQKRGRFPITFKIVGYVSPKS